MDSKTYAIIGVVGSSIYLSLGFIALGSLSSLGSYPYYLQSVPLAAWGETFVSLAIGFVLLTTAWTQGLRSSLSRSWGVVGIMASIGGALNALALMVIPYSNGSTLTSFISLGSVVVLFFGFPLSMASSVGGLMDEREARPPT